MKTRMATKDNKATKRFSRIKKEKQPTAKLADCIEQPSKNTVKRINSTRTLPGYRKA